MNTTESNQKHILLVEDESIIALGEQASLRRFGYDVVVASSGEAAIEVLARAAAAVDLVLMDIDLGSGMDGTEAVTSYGYVEKSASATVLDASIRMAFKLFEARQTLLESEKCLEDLFDNMSDAFGFHEIILDENDRPVDYRFIDVNDVLADRVGMSRRELVGRRALELFPDTERHWIEAFGRVARTGVPEQISHYAGELDRYYEARIYCPRHGYFAAVFVDITERTRGELELRQSEEKFRLLFENMTTGCAIYDVIYDREGKPHDYRYVEVNRAFERLTGIAEGDCVGTTIRELLPGTEEVWFDRFRDAVEKGTPVAYRDYAQEFGKYYEVFAFPPRDGRLAVVFGDITEQMIDEARIETLLREKETLMKEVQHRIKNTMNTMVSLLSLQARALENPQAVAALDDARSRLKSMEVLYDQLYRTEDYRSGSVKQYLESLLRGCMQLFPAEGKICITSEIEEFSLDAKRLSSLGIIVNELVTNAVKHAYHGRDAGLLSVTARRVDNAVLVLVEDDGPGLPESFDPTVSGSFGMTIVATLADQLAGSLNFSRSDGLRVELSFPA